MLLRVSGLTRPGAAAAGVRGAVRFDLEFSPQPLTVAGSRVPATTLLDDTTSIFTALLEQLGLKLDPQQGPAEALVIDSASPPAPN